MFHETKRVSRNMIEKKIPCLKPLRVIEQTANRIEAGGGVGEGLAEATTHLGRTSAQPPCENHQKNEILA